MESIREVEGNSGFTARDKRCDVGFCTYHGTESALQFQIILGNSSLLKVFKSCFSLSVGWEEERFQEVRKAWWGETMSGNDGSG